MFQETGDIGGEIQPPHATQRDGRDGRSKGEGGRFRSSGQKELNLPASAPQRLLQHQKSGHAHPPLCRHEPETSTQVHQEDG